MIEVRNVSKSYGEKNVIDNVSLTVPTGGITSFIGPNGAGKSTLISMISRLLPRDSGEILVDGQSIDTTPSAQLARTLAILKQENDVRVRLTVRDLVSFGRFPYSQGRLNTDDHRRIDDAIEYMALGNLSSRFLDQLSGGQRQRAFIAMVICQDTDYILLDEPLNNLDMNHSVQVMRLLRQLTDDLNKTIILVIHDINFASCHSDRIVALKDGRVVNNGTPDEIIASEPLAEIYDMHIPVQIIEGNRIGVYFS